MATSTMSNPNWTTCGWMLWIEYLIKYNLRVLRMFSYVPRVDHEKIDSIIKRAPESEKLKLKLEQEELRVGERSKLAFVSLIASTLYFIRNIVAISKIVSWFNYSDLQSNFKQTKNYANQTGTSLTLEFACMATNCSRLSAREAVNGKTDDDPSRLLMEDMAELPVFEICDPFAATILMPVKFLPQIGLIFLSMTGFTIFFDNFAILGVQLMAPFANEGLIFAQAPAIGIELIKDRIRVLIKREIVCSYRRFSAQLAAVDSINLMSIPGRASGRLEWMEQVRSVADIAATKFNDLHGKSSSCDEKSLLIRHRRQFVRACLPAARTPWFRNNLMKAGLVAYLCWLTATLFVIGVTVILNLQIQLDRKQQQMEEFALEVRQQNCSIWLTPPEGDSLSSMRQTSPLVTIDLNGFDIRWNWFSLLMNFFFVLIPFYIALSIYTLIYVTVLELTCRQAELENQFLFLIECRRLIAAMGNRSMDTNPHRWRPKGWRRHASQDQQTYQRVLMRSELALVKLEEKFKQANWRIWFLVASLIKVDKSPGLSSRQRVSLALQDLSASVLVDRGFNPSLGYNTNDDEMVFVLVMEKVYINFRLYLEYVDHYSPCMTFILSYSYVLFYGYVLQTIVYHNLISQRVAEVSLITGVGWLMVNTILILASSVHAKGKRLHPLIWSLIALLDNGNNEQESYLKHLWLRQIEHIDLERGIAVKMFGFRITYVKIIQLVIWTATLFVFTIRH